ncbi:MAG: ParB N-terminal domain-containing protein, partial [Planktotalea sp.]|uniref:ParB/RepB/Spo0J family partition protein n=1 Tax=Planktotalea sp. TaxID=2029877 RepID=UPI003C763289
MAKRKRLAPAQSLERARDLDAPLESKSIAGLSRHPAPPIASVAGDASTVAALEELSETLRRARAEGRMITNVPLSLIDENYLVRDRIAVDDDDMAVLRSSLEARGQQTPIEVVDLGDGRFGLISGWRRLQALRAIGSESAKAIITAPREAPDAYVAMIEENEIRVGLSYFERARIVVKAVEAGVFETEKAALQTLFANASRAKRSKIKSFIPVAGTLGNALKFPTQMGERMGLQLSKALLNDPTAPRRLLSALSAASRDSFEAEQDVLNQALKKDLETEKPSPPAKPDASIARQVSRTLLLEMNARGDEIVIKGEGVNHK